MPQENPYRCPETPPSGDRAPDGTRLVARGRRLFLAIAAFLLIAWIGVPLLLGQEPEPIRTGLSIALLYAVWCGHGWALALMTLALILSAIAGLIGLLGVSTEPSVAPEILVVMLAIVVAYVGVALLFLRSETLNAFFRYQRGDAPEAVPEGPVADAADPGNLVTMGSFRTAAEADAKRLALEQEGIRAFLFDEHLVTMNWFLSDAVGGAKLQVAHADADRAAAILRQQSSVRADDLLAKGAVTFPCEQCGRTLTFAGSRRGRVETCPHCGEYVDVPE